MPAVYDLANRGLLPPGFSLVGFARRDWANEDFAQIVHDAVKEHARTPFREEVWKQLAEGFRFVPGDFDDDVRVRPASKQTIEELDESAGTGGNHAFYLSIPPKFFAVVIGQLKEHGLAEQRPARVAPGGRREAVRTRPASRPASSTRSCREVFPPESVFRIDHYLGKETVQNILALRFANQHVRADLERQLRRPRADHHGRGHRHRRPGRLLRRHRRGPRRDPEPPAPAAGADRHGGAGLVRRRARCGPRSRRSSRAVACSRRLDLDTPRAGSTPRAGRAARRCPATSTRTDIPKTSTTETFAAIQLDIDTRRWAGVPFYLRTGKRLGRRVTEVAVVFKRAPHLPFTETATEELGQNALVIRVQPDEGVTLRFGAKVPGTAMEIRDVNMDFAYGGAFTESSPGGVRAAHPRRAPRRPAAVPAARGGRAVLGDPRPDREALGQATADPRSTRPAPGARPRPTRCWPATDATWRRP